MIALASQLSDDLYPATHHRQIHAAAVAALGASKYIPIRKLNCRVSEGVIELTGTVPSFYLKQLAQTVVMQLFVTASVRNLVEVSDEPAVLVSTTCSSQAKIPSA